MKNTFKPKQDLKLPRNGKDGDAGFYLFPKKDFNLKVVMRVDKAGENIGIDASVVDSDGKGVYVFVAGGEVVVGGTDGDVVGNEAAYTKYLSDKAALDLAVDTLADDLLVINDKLRKAKDDEVDDLRRDQKKKRKDYEAAQLAVMELSKVEPVFEKVNDYTKLLPEIDDGGLISLKGLRLLSFKGVEFKTFF